MDKRVVGVVAVAAWLVLAAAIESTLGSLTPVTYASVVLAGLLVMAEYANPRFVGEPWRTRYDRVLGVSVALYTVYAAYRVLLLVDARLQPL